MTTLASIDELAAAAEDAAVIDVREPREYVGGHVPGAVLMPMGQLPSRVGELERHHPVYVICASGNRSRAMSDYLARAGFDAASFPPILDRVPVRPRKDLPHGDHHPHRHPDAR